ncbi:YceD family protein [Atopomonas sediminilitoris]|uniref:YceD family protein n=1 Tax=Atopomonas sediminilitoris TaxID=2919919 RepID=UPI001F4F04DF|nr:YceD family protein [Atopomonas sediminilitoris]MCJ8167794.1 YceD family protein [Atopomonas sediminilitoris]
MLTAPIPSQVDPRKLADRGAVIEGSLPLAPMSRLTSALVDGAGDVQVRLVFDRDEQNFIVLQGHFTVQAKMHCQRCLEPVTLPVEADCHYAVVWSEEQGKALPKDYDALELGEEPLVLAELVEDELILALPIVPMHDSENCQHPAGFAAAPEPSENEVKRSNPFDVLAQLKRDPNA